MSAPSVAVVAAASNEAGEGAPSVAQARRAAQARLMLEGPIGLTVLKLAVPTMTVMFVQSAVNLLEPWYLGHLGGEALAAVALVFPFFMLMNMIAAGAMGGAVSSSVARALGARRLADAEAVLVHAAVIALVMGTVFWAVMTTQGRAIYGFLGAEGRVLDLAEAYTRVAFAGSWFVWLTHTFAAMVRGTGNMVTPAVALLTVSLLQIPLAGAFVFGWGGLPQLGIAGTATGILIGFVLGALSMVGYVLAGGAGLRFRPFATRLEWRLFADILSVGLLASLNAVFTIGTTLFVFFILGGWFTQDAIAAYGIGSRIEFMLVPIVFGIGTALTAMVGTNIGAGQIVRAERIAWTGGLGAGALTLAIGLAAALVAEPVMGVFTEKPEIIAAGVDYLTRVGPCFGFFGLGTALYFASQGAGRMTLPFLSGLMRTVVVAAGGLAAVGWYGWSLEGLFWVVAGGMVLFGLLNSAAVASGAWRRGR